MISFTNKISIENYKMLRRAVGFKEVSVRQAKIGLKNSIIVVAEKEKKVIGMARLITDGGYFYFIVDVIVLPEFQGQGIGRQIISRLMDYVDSSILDKEIGFASLIAADGKSGFYKKFGFNDANGMSQYIEKI